MSLAAKNRALHRSRDAASRGLKKRRTSSAALDHSTSPMARPGVLSSQSGVTSRSSVCDHGPNWRSAASRCGRLGATPVEGEVQSPNNRGVLDHGGPNAPVHGAFGPGFRAQAEVCKNSEPPAEIGLPCKGWIGRFEHKIQVFGKARRVPLPGAFPWRPFPLQARSSRHKLCAALAAVRSRPGRLFGCCVAAHKRVLQRGQKRIRRFVPVNAGQRLEVLSRGTGQGVGVDAQALA